MHLPEGQTSSAGPAAVALAEVAGLRLDPWQQWVVDRVLGEKDEWYYNEVLDRMMRRSTAYETALIVARQNGKGAILEALELAWLYILGAKVIVHSAHEFATSREHFQRIQGLIEGTDELRAELARGGIKWSHGDESITLQSGQRLLFKTRTKGAARGFSIDKLVMDEAMILASAGVAAMMFATSARPDVQIVLSGSAGNKESEHFGRARSRGIKGIDPRLFLAEWSADLCDELCPKDCPDHDRRDDPLVWAKANPGLGIRLQGENVQSEFLGYDPDVFNCERLSVGDWPADGEAWGIISEQAWDLCEMPASTLDGPPSFGIYTTQNKRYSCIAAAGDNGLGSTHIEVTGRNGFSDYRHGTHWVVARCEELGRKFRRAQFVIGKNTQAAVYIEPLEKAGLKVISPTITEYAQACGEFFAAVSPIGGAEPTMRHINQSELRTAVAGAQKKDREEGWTWDSKESTSDITPLIAATMAHWGHRKRVNKPKPKPMAMWG